ncbi:CopG family ribbon-helix-helix protein [Natrinema sp. CGMCC1.2065]|uniref:CopG family ribbon-helix-helix protein n=1 Tax=Natrinema sp. CGMCC1.2065 TaxID=3445767 RepID=UPI003F4A682F
MPNPSINVPPHLLEAADAIAHARSGGPGENCSRSEIFRDALEQYVEAHQEEVDEGRRKMDGSDDSADGAQATN